MRFVKKHFSLILVVFLSIFSILPLLSNGFFPMHDDTQVVRVFEMSKSLRDGTFPVRWVADLGYGYGYSIFNFYAPLAYYIGAFFNVLGFSALLSTKLMMIFGIVLSGIFMYFLAREFWGKIGGLVSGLFYIYAPYHALDIYVRGDVAEFWAYAFIPLMFLGFYKLYKDISNTADLAQNNSKFKIQNSKLQFKIKNLWKWVIIGSLGYAGTILSHNLTAMMVTPFIILLIIFLSYIFYRKGNILNTFYLIFSALLGIMLSAFYWLPALFEMKYTNVMSQIGGGADFRNHFVCPYQLWESLWAFGGSTFGCTDGMSFMAGKLHLILSLLAIIFLFIFLVKRKLLVIYSDKIIIVFLSIIGFCISIFLTIELSKPVWESVSFMAFFQYPWRFLILTSFFSSILSGFIIWFFGNILFKKQKFNNFAKSISAILIIIILVFLNSKFFAPHFIYSKSDNDYINGHNIKWTTSKISDEYMPKDFIKTQSEIDIINEKIIIDTESVVIINRFERTQNIKTTINSQKNTEILLKIAHFPSWNILVDGIKVKPKLAKNGYIIPVSKGEHKIEAVFKQTPIEIFGNILSLAGMGILIIGIIYPRKKTIF